MITIEVACVTSTKQISIPCVVAENTTIQAAILQSGILAHFPEIDLTQQKAGIFGKVVDMSRIVSNKDRIEIYWPLKLDPKKARVLRAQRKESSE